jgi:guanylate kinase
MTDLEFLVENAPDYQPSVEVAEQLESVTLAPLIGPVAVGKSACMERAIDMATAFGKVQSFTTRPKRPDEAESEYRFLPHNDASLEQIAIAARRGELVQYAVHPTTGYVYGSDRSDYQQLYMMLDALANSVPAIRRLPFGKIVEMSIVAEPEQWQKRFSARNMDPADAKKRILEGRDSLRWSLDQGDSMLWVCNTAGRLSKTGNEILGLVLGRREPDPRNRMIGQRLLRALENLA